MFYLITILIIALLFVKSKKSLHMYNKIFIMKIIAISSGI